MWCLLGAQRVALSEGRKERGMTSSFSVQERLVQHALYILQLNHLRLSKPKLELPTSQVQDHLSAGRIILAVAQSVGKSSVDSKENL